MHTVSRLKVITPIVGQQMVAKLTQHHLLKQSSREIAVLTQVCSFFKVCIKDGVFLRGFVLFFRRVSWLPLWFAKKHPNNSDSLTILQLKGTKSSKICFQQTVNKSLAHQQLSVLFGLHSAFLVSLEIHIAGRHAVTVWVMSEAWQSRMFLSEALNCPSSSLSGHSANDEATWATSIW